MATEDVSFTFNPMPFKNGIKSVQNSMSNMESTAQGVTRGMSRAFTKLTGVLALVTGATLSIRGALNAMPEIGQVFGMAGDVIKQNLLWPIRKALMPALQRILDWTRDNRGRFVEWGQAVLGVLKGAWEIAKVLWEALKGVGSVIMNVLGRHLPFMNRSITDTMNILQFKMVLVAHAMQDAMERVAEFWEGSGLARLFERLGQLVQDVVQVTVQIAQAFGSGVASRAKQIGEAYNTLANAVTNLINALFGEEFGASDELLDFFEQLGGIVASGLVAVINGIAAAINGLATAFNAIKEFFKPGGTAEKLLEFLNIEYGEDLMRSESAVGGGGFRALQGMAAEARGESVDDALIRPGKDPIRFNPKDTIIATQTPAGVGGGSVAVSVDMTGSQFTVTEGNAEAAGENFGYGMGQRIRDMLLSEMTRRGD